MAWSGLPELIPWRRRPLTIPPDSMQDWFRLAVWETWMGVLVSAALGVGAAGRGVRARSISTSSIIRASSGIGATGGPTSSGRVLGRSCSPIR